MVTATQHCISQLCHSIVQSVATQNPAFPSTSLPPQQSPWSMPCAVHSMASPFTCLCLFLDTLLRISGVFIPSILRRQLCFSYLTSSTFDLLDNMGLDPGFAGDSNTPKIVKLALHTEQPGPLPGPRRGKSDHAGDLPRLWAPCPRRPESLHLMVVSQPTSLLILNIYGADWMSVTENLLSASQ